MTDLPSTARLAYTYAEAAALVGYSEATIKRAVRAGDLKVVAGTIDGQPIDKPVVRRADLDAWLRTITTP